MKHLKNLIQLFAVVIMAFLVTNCDDTLNMNKGPNPISGNIDCCDGDKALTHQLNKEIQMLRAAIAPYRNFKNAQEKGNYVVAVEYPGPPPYIYEPGMGIHYLNPDLFADDFNLLHPEVLIYVPDGNRMRFVGVEYVIPVTDENQDTPPEGFTGDADVWTINETFNVWALHVWLGEPNPDGLFTAYNPNIP